MKTPLEALNDTSLTGEQKAVVTATEDFIRVKALAGTGKTFTAVQRVLYQKAIGREVSHVLTFTRSARKTISKKLEEAGVEDVPVKTLHSFAAEMVNDFREERGLGRVTISDGSRIIYSMIRDEYGRTPKPVEVGQVQQMATLLANGAVYSFMTSTSKEELKYLATRYQEAKEKAGEIDWDDLLLMATGIAKMQGITLDGEVIVDEAQDLTLLQMEYLKQLDPPRLTLILDPNQNIFGFAGVEEAAMNDKRFKEYTLSKSFRSAQEILDLANKLIPENLTSDITGGKVTWVESSHKTQVEDVIKILEPGDCILGRFRSSARNVLLALDPTQDPKHEINDTIRVGDHEYTFGSIHWAKGQEWNRVFILDLVDDGFAGLPMTIEERRILYVAITRAMKEVVLMSITEQKPGWFGFEQ